jgi:hypothetical protein
MSKFKTYTIPHTTIKGKNDLLDIYAWHGNSQGDESRTNDVEEALSMKGWMSPTFKDVDCTNQEAVDAEVLRRIAENDKYIKELMKSGEYLKEYKSDIEFTMIHDPKWDTPKSNIKLESYRIVMFDMSK